MWRLWTLSAAFLSLLAHGEEKRETLELLGKIPHSGYSEGLDYLDGYLWHTLPEALVKIDPKDGSVVERFPPASKYNEAPAWFEGKLFVLSYSDNGIYQGIRGKNGFRFTRVGTTPEIHGWGLTHDGKHLILTGDYSSKLYFLDPKSFALKRTLETNRRDLEDLAWDGTGIWSSSFTQHRGCIFRIDPKTGNADTLYQLPEPELCPIVDGIAYDETSLWVTGKNCPSIFRVKVPLARKVSSKP